MTQINDNNSYIVIKIIASFEFIIPGLIPCSAHNCFQNSNPTEIKKKN